MKAAFISFALGLALIVSSVQTAAETIVDDAALTALDQGGNWLGFGRNYSEQRFSPLDQITADNVADLGVDWYVEFPNDRSLTATPLIVDGVMYIVGTYNVVRALDAKNGKLIWEYDPKTIEVGGNRLRITWDLDRGVAYWKGKVYVSTLDGRLIALNGKDGSPIWTTQTFDTSLSLYITGAPKVFRGKVLVGNGGTEVGANRGFVTAYDAETGDEAWKFWIVPGNPADGFENNAMKMAAKTWTGEWWKYGGGGNAWHGVTFDPEFNHVYIGTGNGSPWNQKVRSPGGGDNLFLCSIVALDADTGAYKWHYQTTPGETWDYNSNMDIVLADLDYGGQTVKALMHAPKNGFFYVINRPNGKLIAAKPYVKLDWAVGIDQKTGRPIERTGARYEDGEELVWPSAVGGHNWHAMSYNPMTKLVYIPVVEMPGTFKDQNIEIEAWKSPYFKFQVGVEFGDEIIPRNYGTGALRAWDPIHQKVVWEHPLPGVWNAGTMTTAGNLMFQGWADGTFHAHQASDGEPLWSIDLGHGISAPPVTYAIDGKQYVSILVGWGGAAMSVLGGVADHGWAYGLHTRRLVTFSLDGKVALPKQPPPTYAEPIKDENFEIDAGIAAQGGQIWSDSCALCHGVGAYSAGASPDLRASAIPIDFDAFKNVVIEGSLAPRGMPRFTELTDADLTALQHYLRKQANLKETEIDDN